MFKTASPNSKRSKSSDTTLLRQGSPSNFIQPKLNVGKPGDKYEVEADHIADQVVAKTNEQSAPFFAPAPTLQKQNDEDLQTQQEDTLQEKPISESITPLIQTNTEEEIQEKATEDAPEETIQQKTEESSLITTEIQDTYSSEAKTPIQKTTEEDIQEKEDEEIQEKEEEETQQLQMQSSGGDENPSSGFENNLNSSKGGGSPLSSDTRQEMESGFGADFSGVRIHNDSNAVQMNQQLGSQAFANGSDIYFNEGKYNPGSNSGKHLLAHELTHTVQQGGADVQRKPEISKTSNNIQLLPDIIGSRLNEYARFIPGYSLFTVLIEYNPILGETVRKTPVNVVEGLLELVPVWGVLLVNKLREYDALQTAFDWINDELARFNLTTGKIERLIDQAWEDMDFVRFDPFDYNVGVLERTFTGLYNDVISFADSLKDQILEFIKDAVVSPLVGFMEANSPTYVLATKVLGRKFPLDEEVNATTVEILEDFLILIGKETEVEEMKNKGTLQETADWIDTQLATFLSLLGRFNALFTRAWDAFSFENLRDIPNVFNGIYTDFTELLDDFLSFAAEVAQEVLAIIKRSLLEWLNSFAADIPGFTLLTVIIRKNPLTDEEVPRSVQNIIRGFMGLIPGGEARYQELTESGVIPRAAGQIEALIARLGISRTFIVELFTNIWNSFTIDDLFDPSGAFERVAAQFGEPISRLFQFVTKVVKILVNLLLEIMGIPPELIGNIMANIMSAFEDIKRDPIGFLLNLMNALKDGFVNFLNNIGTHLLNGMQTWLFGTLADAGVEMPEDLSIRSLLGMAMDVLGITVDNVLDRLAEKIGPERMEQIRSVLDTLTGIWAFVKDVIERGPIAIWEYVQEKLSNLWEVIKNGIISFIQEKVIQQAIGWLLSFLDVTGIMPVIRGVQTVFNAIVSFIEKLREILGIVNSFVAGIADIARGSIQSAANFLERALADGIPVAISFLAKQLGLGDISEKIAEMIENTREMINEGIDWLIDKALEAGTAFLNALGLGGNDTEETPEEETPTGPIGAALTEIDTEGEREKDEGGVTEGEAEGIKNTVNRDHATVINISSVTDGGDTWNYNYIQRSVKQIPKTGSPTPGSIRARAEQKGLSGVTLDHIETAYSTYGSALFSRAELDRTLNLSARATRGHLNTWNTNDLIFTFGTSETDTEIQYTFDQSQSGDRTAVRRGGDTDYDQLIQKYQTMYTQILNSSTTLDWDPTWSDTEKQSHIDTYRANFRTLVIDKYENSLKDLDDNVIKSHHIPSELNAVRGVLFELWLERNNVMTRTPRPMFFKNYDKDKPLKQDRDADGISGSDLVEAKALRDDRAPSTEEKEQMEDYEKILSAPKIPWVRNQSTNRTFGKVIYNFTRESIETRWTPHLQRLIGGALWETNVES